MNKYAILSVAGLSLGVSMLTVSMSVGTGVGMEHDSKEQHERAQGDQLALIAAVPEREGVVAGVALEESVYLQEALEMEKRPNGNTPLTGIIFNYAPRLCRLPNGRYEVVENPCFADRLEFFLKRYHDQINEKDGNNFTPLIVGASYGYSLTSMKRLLDAGADPNIQSAEGNTALDIARQKDPALRNDEVIALLERVTQQ